MPACPYLVAKKVHFQPGHCDPVRALAAAMTAAQRFDPRDQLLQRKWLRQIIVTALAQAFHPVIHVAKGRHDQDRYRIVRRPYRLQDRHSVDTGQHAVENDDVVGLLSRGVKSVPAVPADVHDMAAFAQSLGDIIRQGGVVLDQQQLHPAPSACPEP